MVKPLDDILALKGSRFYYFEQLLNAFLTIEQYSVRAS